MTISPEKIPPRFHENFTSGKELGAAVSVWQGEEEVLSLAEGWTTKNQEKPWEPDTLVPIWSATKGPAALTVLLALHDAGIKIHDPVEDLWPELKAAENKGLSFGQLLAHQSGLAALSPDNRPSIHEHGEVVRALEKQDTFWQAGFGHGYHPRTFGALTEEIVRRATGGSTLGEFWREKVARPAEVDVFIGGLTSNELDRLATIYPPLRVEPSEEEAVFYETLRDQESLSLWAFSSPRGIRNLGDINKIEYLQSGIPSLGGVASASGLGKFYAILANKGLWKGDQIVPEKIIGHLGNPLSEGTDFTLLIPTAFSTGFMIDPIDPDTGEKHRRIFGPSRDAFGQPGAGGSHAFADPSNGISFAYVMNQMESGILPNDRSLGLVNVLY